MFDISLVPIVVSTIAVITLGMVWYSPRLFGTVWAREIGGFKHDDAEAMTKAVLSGALQNFIIVFILANLMELSEVSSDRGPLVIALWVAILVAATHLGPVLWERKSVTYFIITTGYLVVSLMLSALILINWPWA